MTFITCTSRGCHQSSEAKLDVATNEVICEECGNVITGITEIMKKMLKSTGQIVRNKGKKAFNVFCDNCKTSVEYYIDGDGKAYCKVCKHQVKVSAVFIKAKELTGEPEVIEEPKAKKGKK